MRAYERLLKYVKVWTTSDPESGTHPSTMRQFDLAHQLVQELKDLGLADADVAHEAQRGAHLDEDLLAAGVLRAQHQLHLSRRILGNRP